MLVHNTLVGLGLRDRIRIGAAGKITSAFDIARTMAMGADWCNAGRGFMFALGCIQSQSCHTDRCPTGVATQDPNRWQHLDVADKAIRGAAVPRQHAEGAARPAVRGRPGASAAAGPGTHPAPRFAGGDPLAGGAVPFPGAGRTVEPDARTTRCSRSSGPTRAAIRSRRQPGCVRCGIPSPVSHQARKLLWEGHKPRSSANAPVGAYAPPTSPHLRSLDVCSPHKAALALTATAPAFNICGPKHTHSGG